ncbi:MAG: thioredoxin-dependent thiol peroxidase [Planctomycetota bacterium]
MTNPRLKPGDKAPALGLKDTDDKLVQISDYAGKWLVVYFYPKDDTSGCTMEARDFSENIEKFRSVNAEVVGISPDSVDSHRKFCKKHDLKVTLLSDSEHKVLEAWDVWHEKSMYGRSYWGVVRTTYLIAPDGTIAHVWPNVKVKGHVEDVLSKIPK